MGRFVKGDVVVVPFPFSDLSTTKRRPALVVADLTGDDVVLCQITTRLRLTVTALPLQARELVGVMHKTIGDGINLWS